MSEAGRFEVDASRAKAVLIGDHGTLNATFIEAPAVLPPGRVVNLPPRNPGFTGREDLSGRLVSGLDTGPVAVVAMYGLGGIGKSQLALEHAHRGVAAGQYEVAWWIRAEDPVTLAEDLAALAPGLGVPVSADQEQTIAAVRAVLQSRSRWLVVFDNAPDQDAVRGWVPGGAGDVLITSRDQQWSGLARTVDVEVFTRPESIRFLEQETGQSGSALGELAGLLGDLPLALSQAAAYIQRSGGLSVAKYVALYEDQEAAGRLLAEAAGDGYPQSVATTWLVHFTWLATRQPAALELLQLISYLNPDSINLSVLLAQPELLGTDLYPHLTAACGNLLGTTDTVKALTGAGLVTRLDDDRVSIHRLVSKVTRHHHDTGSQQRAEHTITLLTDLIPDEPWEPQHWPQCAQLAPHITTATTYTQTTDAAVALVRLGQYLSTKAELQPAKTALQHALTINESVYGPKHPQVAVTLTNLGNVEQQLGELAVARTTLTRALAIFEPIYTNRIARLLGQITPPAE
jgi:tetratricopeptide (TPR) repeat protein